MVKVEPGCSSYATRRNFTALITFNENRTPRYNGKCKLQINLVSKTLFVEPNNEYFNDITAPFSWKFVRSKNVLFVFANFDFQDFVLVFKTEEICNKVFNGIFKNKDADFVENELLKERFFNPLFKNASQKLWIKEILEEWIQQLDEKEKNEYLKLLKEHQEHSEINGDENDMKDVKVKIEPLPEKSRKRRHNEIGYNVLSDSTEVVDQGSVNGCNEDSHVSALKAQNTSTTDRSHEEHLREKSNCDPEKLIVLSPNFEFQMKNTNNGTNRKTLIIFDANVRNYCHTYFCVKKSHIFYCNGCRRKQTNVSAKIYKNDENVEYVILSNKKHVCSPQNYTPQNEIIILRPPKFKFMEATEMQKSKLFIFDSSDPKLCYTFSSQRQSEKRYHCLGCILVAQQKNKTNANKCRQTKQVVSVYLQKDDGPNGEYFVQIIAGEKHICQPQKYEPEKYEMKILKPRIDYVLFRNMGKNGNVNLVIYHPDDKKLCYKYYKITSTNFQCPGCSKKKTHVSAKLHQDSNGNEYLTINEKKHVCDPIEYSSIIKPNTVILNLAFEEPKKKEIDEKRIVQLPKFELQRNRLGVPERRLIIFFDDEQKLCYDYRYGKNQFLCKKCNVTAKLNVDKEDGNEKCVVLSKNKHKCEPVKYEPEKEIVENRIIRLPNFELLKNGRGVPERRLIVFFDDEQKLCYDYRYSKDQFLCKKCNVTAKLNVDEEDGNEKFVILSKNKHKCQPVEFKKLQRK